MIGRKLIGIPLKLTLGEKNLKKGLVEIKKRRTGEIFLVTFSYHLLRNRQP